MKKSRSNSGRVPRLAIFPGKKYTSLVVIVLRTYISMKAFQIAHFSSVQFVLCHLYCNKVVKNFKREKRVSYTHYVIGAAFQFWEV